MSDSNVIPANTEETPSLDSLKEIYLNQHRECWMCAKVVQMMNDGKLEKIKEEQKCHFATCVLTWDHLHNHGDSEAVADEHELIEKAA